MNGLLGFTRIQLNPATVINNTGLKFNVLILTTKISDVDGDGFKSLNHEYEKNH